MVKKVDLKAVAANSNGTSTNGTTTLAASDSAPQNAPQNGRENEKPVDRTKLPQRLFSKKELDTLSKHFQRLEKLQLTEAKLKAFMNESEFYDEDSEEKGCRLTIINGDTYSGVKFFTGNPRIIQMVLKCLAQDIEAQQNETKAAINTYFAA